MIMFRLRNSGSTYQLRHAFLTGGFANFFLCAAVVVDPTFPVRGTGSLRDSCGVCWLLPKEPNAC